MMRFKAKAARSFLVHLRKAVEAALGKPPDPPPKVLYNPTAEESEKRFRKWKRFAIDIETPSTTSSKILSVAVSGNRKVGMVWDLQRPYPELGPFREALLSEKEKIFQNGEFDIQRLERNGFNIRKVSRKGRNLIWDTMIEMQILHPDEPANLSYLVSMACDVEAWKHTRKTDSRKKFLLYNALDAVYDFRVYQEGTVE